ncbi:hypothetical protein DRQ33_01570 [bacterium]|nr:MAG: hypothetical protein DRQ33_01570 [bacterium]
MRNIIFVIAILSISVYAMLGVPAVEKPDMRVGEIVFEPTDEWQIGRLEQFAEKYNGEVRKVTKVLPIYMMKFPSIVPQEEIEKLVRGNNYKKFWSEYEKCRAQVWEMVNLIRKTGLVKYAQPNYIYYMAYIPNDPYHIDDGMYGPTAGPDQYAHFITNSQGGWNYTIGSRDVLLCIIDSGVDVDHPDLMDNIWINPGEDIDGDGELYDFDDLNGIDDDGNGYVDDLFGYDFVGGNVGGWTPGDPAEEDWNPDIHYMGDDGWGEPDPSCGSGDAMFDMGVAHGTHCAGISGAVSDNASLFAGSCGRISIVPVRVMNAGGSGNSVDMVAGVEYAALIGADVASMSFGGMMGAVDTALVNACQYAYSSGVALIAASGNEGAEGVSSPASSEWTLAVGSFNSDRQRAWFSNYGAELDVLAGGGDGESSGWEMVYTEVIWSTWVYSVYEADSAGAMPGEHTISGMAGTSMACPHAAGLAALIKSILPSISPDSVYNIIRNTAQDVGPTGWDSETGYGIIDFQEALGAICSYTYPIFFRPERYEIISACGEECITGIIQSPDEIAEISAEIDGTPVSVDFDGDSFYIAADGILATESEHSVCITSIINSDDVELVVAPFCRTFTIDYSPPYLTDASPIDTARSQSPDISISLQDEFSVPDMDSIWFEIDDVIYSPDEIDELNYSAVLHTSAHSLEWEDGDTVGVCVFAHDIVDYCEPNAMDTCWSFVVWTSGIDEKLPEGITMKVFPNPTNPAGCLKLTLPEMDIISIRMFDLKGRLVSEIHNGWLNSGTHHIPIPMDLPSGEYTIKLIGTGIIKTTNISVIK